MQKVYCLYKLKPDVQWEDYLEWSRDVDQAITREQRGVQRFNVYRMQGTRGGAAPWDVVEDIDVDSWDAWQECLARPEMADVVKGFREMADPDTAVTIYGGQI